MSFLNQKEQTLLRKDVLPENIEAGHVTDIKFMSVQEIVDTLDGDGRQYIEKKMADRYAVTVEKAVSETGDVVSKFVTQSKAAAAAAIKFGLFEVLDSYLFQKTNQERNLFRRQGTYNFLNANDELKAEIEEARNAGNSMLAMARTDSLAEAVGSSALLVQILGDKFNYQPIVRNRIFVVFADEIYADGVSRPTDKMNIDEASIVVIQLSEAGMEGVTDFVAYFAQSEKYPNGRQVKFSSNSWYTIPDAGQTEYLVNGESANPIVIANKMYYQGTGPQYPIVPWYNDSSGFGKSILPIETGYYEQCKELNLASSRVMLSVLKSARGIIHMMRQLTDGNSVIPDVLDEGPVVTTANIDVKSVPGGNSQAAMEIIQSNIVNTGSARGIPAHLLVTKDAVMPSGIALQIASIPLLNARESRAAANKAGMSRKFEIEKRLAALQNDAAIAAEVTQTWEPDNKLVPEFDEEVRANVEFGLKNKLLDLEGAAMQLYKISTKEEAANYLKELKTLSAEEKKGLF